MPLFLLAAAVFLIIDVIIRLIIRLVFDRKAKSTSQLVKREKEDGLKPIVNIIHYSCFDSAHHGEFVIPGGVFISDNHCWLFIKHFGNVDIGIDDFAHKLLGKINGFVIANKDQNIQKGDVLFVLKKDDFSIPFKSPITGKVAAINEELLKDFNRLKDTPYEENKLCSVEADNLENELRHCSIGQDAVNFYNSDIKKCQALIKEIDKELIDKENFMKGKFDAIPKEHWNKIVQEFFAA